MDQFTPKKLKVTKQLCGILKDFRISHKAPANVIAYEVCQRSPSWISKLENGVYKTIKSDDFTKICNLISQSNHGVIDFLTFSASDHYSYLMAETKMAFDNIEDFIVEYDVAPEMVSELAGYTKEKSITAETLSEKINANEDIKFLPDYNKFPENIWMPQGIKLNIPAYYIESLLYGKVETIHPYIAESIFYAMYSLGREDNPRLMAQEALKRHGIERQRFKAFLQTQQEIKEKEDPLDPEVKAGIQSVEQFLANVSAKSLDGGKSGIKQIMENISADPGYYYAFMLIDVTALRNKPHFMKQELLYKLKDMVLSFASAVDDDISFYN